MGSNVPSDHIDMFGPLTNHVSFSLTKDWKSFDQHKRDHTSSTRLAMCSCGILIDSPDMASSVPFHGIHF